MTADRSAVTEVDASNGAGPTDRLVTRWPAARRFLVTGTTSIVAGGIVAAVTRPTGFELGSWLAAYLVLVGGVAQIALGAGQAWLAERPPRSGALTSEFLAWNLGLGATIAGSLGSAPMATTVGGAACVVALALFLRGVRHGGTGWRWPLVLYRSVIAMVAVSAPVGLALAWSRHG